MSSFSVKTPQITTTNIQGIPITSSSPQDRNAIVYDSTFNRWTYTGVSGSTDFGNITASGINSLASKDLQVGYNNASTTNKNNFYGEQTNFYYKDDLVTPKLEVLNGVRMQGGLNMYNSSITGVNSIVGNTSLTLNTIGNNNMTLQTDGKDAVIISGTDQSITFKGDVYEQKELIVTDGLIKVGAGNTGSDNISLGFYGMYGVAPFPNTARFCGLARDQGDSGIFKLFNNVIQEPTLNNIDNITNLNSNLGYLSLGILSATGINVTGTITATGISAGNITATGINTWTLGATGISAGNITATGITISTFSTAGIIHNSAAGVLSSSLVVNNDVDPSAGIVDTKLATISTAGKVSNSATTATNLNTASAIVARDSGGSFSAGNITATGFLASTGVAGTPSYSFTGDTDTGMYSSGANTLDFSTGGINRLSIDSSGNGIFSGQIKKSAGSMDFVSGNDYYTFYNSGITSSTVIATVGTLSYLYSSGGILSLGTVGASADTYIGQATQSVFISGTPYCSKLSTNGTVSTRNGTGELYVSSDIRLKNSIEYFTESSLDKILQLKPCTFKLNGDEYGVYEGFIAQDVETVIPNCIDGKKYPYQFVLDEEKKVVLDEEGKPVMDQTKPRYRGLNQASILAHLVKAIQELTQISKEFDKSNKELIQKLNTANDTITSQQNTINNILSRLEALENPPL